MIPIDEKIKEICERRKFTSFWEAFDYMKLANYSELEAIMMSLQLFNGKIWDKVIFAKESINHNTDAVGDFTLRIVGTGDTIDYDNILGDEGIDDGVDYFNECDDTSVKIYIMTDEADEIYLPVYKAYAATREYAPNLTLEKHIKIITTNLTSELGIQLFNDWDKTT